MKKNQKKKELYYFKFIKKLDKRKRKKKKKRKRKRTTKEY